MEMDGKTIMKATIAGMFVAFVWGATEWMIPWYNLPYLDVANPELFHTVMDTELPENGMYIWPKGMESLDESGKPSQVVYFMAKQSPEYYDPGRFMSIQLLTNAGIWLIISFILVSQQVHGHLNRVGLVVILALLGTLTHLIPMWNWWGFSNSYLLVRFANLLLGWVLAGFVVSLVIGRNLTKESSTS